MNEFIEEHKWEKLAIVEVSELVPTNNEYANARISKLDLNLEWTYQVFAYQFCFNSGICISYLLLKSSFNAE